MRLEAVGNTSVLCFSLPSVIANSGTALQNLFSNGKREPHKSPWIVDSKQT